MNLTLASRSMLGTRNEIAVRGGFVLRNVLSLPSRLLTSSKFASLIPFSVLYTLSRIPITSLSSSPSSEIILRGIAWKIQVS